MKLIATRLLATFVYNAGAIIPTAGLLGGWAVWKAALTAGVSATVEVAVRESKRYLASIKDIDVEPV